MYKPQYNLFPIPLKPLLVAALAAILGMTNANAEKVTFASSSPYQLSDALTGPLERNIDIPASLEFPANAKEKTGALVFIHGSGGPLERHQKYLKLARELGLASFQINSFKPRGVTSTIGSQTSVTAAMMTIDAHYALHYLSNHPRIDPSKIFLMGSSKGGTTAIFSAWSPVRERLIGSLDYAARIALYPACVDIEDRKLSDRPFITLIGDKDIWTPADRCSDMTTAIAATGKPWSIKLYQGAYHGFDDATRPIRAIPNAYSLSGCDFALGADGIEYERNSNLKLTKSERRRALGACAKKGGVKLGGNHALPQLMKDVEAFLRAHM